MKEVKALAVMTRPELEQAIGQMNVLIHELRVTIRNHAQSIRDRDAVIEAAENRRAELETGLKDADHLCKWLLQSDISEADRERVIRDNGIAFALIIAPTEPRP